MEKCCVRTFLWLVIFGIWPLITEAESDNQNDGSEVIHLDEIVISATRTPASLENIPASTSVVTQRQIRSSTAFDLGHLLGATNIMEILDYGPGGVSLASIRGSSSEQVLVLVDGERINDPRSGVVDLDNMPITYAKRIEIVRGGQSAMYGADAAGGIINIVTKKPTGTKARAWSTLGAYDSASYGLEASRQFKTVSGTISFSRMSTEADFPFEDKFGRERIRENADYVKRDIFGRLKWDAHSATTLRLSFDHYYSDKGNPGFIGNYSSDASKRDKSSGFRLDLEQDLTEGILCKLSVHKRDTTLRYIDPQEPYPVDDTHKTDAVGSELQSHFLRNTDVPLICGLIFRNDSITSTALEYRERGAYGGYAQQELGRDLDGTFLSLSRIAIFPAIRWDHYSDFDAGVSPKLGFLASFGRYRIITVKANIGSSYRAPTLNELYWPPDPFAFGNPDLEPERSNNMDAGIHLLLSKPSALPRISMIRCGVSYFRNLFRDRIQWSPGEDGKWSPQNLSEACSEGLEVEVRTQISFWNVSDLLSLRMNYTFLKAEDMLQRNLIYRPRHALGYALRVGTERLWTQIQGLYYSRRYYTIQNTKWLEPFMKHDIQLGMERRLWDTASLGFVFEVKNILDKRYQLVADYPLPGREWNIKTSIGIGG